MTNHFPYPKIILNAHKLAADPLEEWHFGYYKTGTQEQLIILATGEFRG
jgi:hypothetical protein